MITLEELEKEFDEKYSKSPNKLVFKIHIGGFVNSDYVLKEAIDNVKEFYQAKINQLIDEMVGIAEKRFEDEVKYYDGDYACEEVRELSELLKQLKEYKKEFNK